ncbi:MAG TPA: glycosyltransferase family 39 protein, partial [Thermoanaerobaculia bacterium]|nr:glycosyltransferase family 39 protein [Thermoanaerobaculia bacterium]
MRSDAFFLILALIALLGLAAMAPALVPADLNLTYPFMDGDSHDWIANGLRLTGEDVRYLGRAPLLPLVIALLHRIEALSWLPLLLQALFRGTALAFYGLAARLAGRWPAFVAALALLVNDSLQGLSLQVMADVPAACLLFLAARSFLLAREGAAPRRYVESGLFAGLSTLTQAAGALWVPAAFLTAALHRRRDFRSPWLWASLLPPLALPLLWRAVQPPAFGGSGGVAREQWLLLDLHAGSVPFYLYALVSLLGLPGALLLAAGLGSAARRMGRDEAGFLAAALLAATTFFFVFLYDYNAKRFLCYG